MCPVHCRPNGGTTGGLGELNSGTIINDIYYMYVGPGTEAIRVVPGISTIRPLQTH